MVLVMYKKSTGFIRSSLLSPQGERLVSSALCNRAKSGLPDAGGEGRVVSLLGVSESSQSTLGGKVSSSALGFDGKLI